MGKRNRAFCAALGIMLAAFACLNSCNKTDLPLGIYAPDGLDVPTPTPTPIQGSFHIALTDLDKAANFTNINVVAVEPGGALTLTSNSGSSGVASFTPLPAIRPGNWTVFVEPQPSSVFAPCTFLAPINSANQTVTIAAGGASLMLVPNTITSYNSQNGGLFIYNLVYYQPNPLFIPVTFSLSSVPHNWTISSSPVTLGYVSNAQGSVTVSGVNCVDQAPSFSVTAFDNTGSARASSEPQTITKTFNSNLQTIFTVTASGRSSNDTSDAGAPCFNCSGYPQSYWMGNILLNYPGACTYPMTLNLSWSAGTCGCGDNFFLASATLIGSMLLNLPKTGCTAAIECSASNSVTFSGNGPWPFLFTSAPTNPIVYLKVKSSQFPDGIPNTPVTFTMPNSGSVTAININY